MNEYAVRIYTIDGNTIDKNIVAPSMVADFDKQLCQAIESGGAMLDTTDGTKFIINTAAIAAIEIAPAEKH